jgi:hypothetical protein
MAAHRAFLSIPTFAFRAWRVGIRYRHTPNMGVLSSKIIRSGEKSWRGQEVLANRDASGEIARTCLR